MSNLKFTLCARESGSIGLGYSLYARAFDFQSLQALHRAVQNGVFGHYSKKRYYLVPIEEIRRASSFREYSSERPFCDLDTGIQMYPKGGSELNADLLALFPASLAF